MSKWVKEGAQLSAVWYRSLFNFYNHVWDFSKSADEATTGVGKFVSKFDVYDDLVEWMKYWLA